MRAYFLVLCMLSIAYAKPLSQASNFTEVERALQKSQRQFSYSFFEQVINEINGNFVISPLSAYTALSLLAYGAAGNTSRQIFDALYVSPNNSRLAKDGIRGTLARLEKTENITLEMATRLMLSEDFQVKASYQDLSRAVFDSEAMRINFSDPKSVVQSVNDWVMNKTHNKIKKMMEPDDISSETLMILLNAVYFDADWYRQFGGSSTKNSTFYLNATSKKKVPTMRVDGKFEVGEIKELDAQFFILPYKNRDIRMTVLIPNGIDGLKKIEDNIHKINASYLDGLVWRDEDGSLTSVVVNLPKFKVENNMPLNTIFEKMGMRDMFGEQSNFKKMTKSPVYVDKILQKTYIDVSERGTEAAVVVEEFMGTKSLHPVFKANRPFLFVISDPETIIFQGRVVDPQPEYLKEEENELDIELEDDDGDIELEDDDADIELEDDDGDIE